MKSRVCKIILLLLMLIAIIACGLLLSGEYFFNYAFVRTDGRPKGAARDISSDVSDQDRRTIQKNQDIAEKASSAWINVVNSEKISITSDDGLKLVAINFPNNENAHKYVIVIHGYSDKKEDFYDIAHNYYNKGFSALCPDLRAHGESEGKYVGMGWLDRNDIKLWIAKILKNDPKAEIVLHGVSMGGATAMMVSGDILPDNVKAIVEDCGFSSAWKVFAAELKKRFNLPSFPFINAGSWVVRLHAGYSISQTSSVDQIKKSSLPLLIIHGDLDDFAPVSMAYEIHEAAPNSELLVIHGAGHAESRFLEPEIYYNKVWKFLDRSLKSTNLL